MIPRRGERWDLQRADGNIATGATRAAASTTVHAAGRESGGAKYDSMASRDRTRVIAARARDMKRRRLRRERARNRRQLLETKMIASEQGIARANKSSGPSCSKTVHKGSSEIQFSARAA